MDPRKTMIAFPFADVLATYVTSQPGYLQLVGRTESATTLTGPSSACGPEWKGSLISTTGAKATVAATMFGLHQLLQDRASTRLRVRTSHMMAGFMCFVACVLMLSASKVAAQGQHSVCLSLQPSPSLPPFVDRLPIPALINVSNGIQLVLGAYKITQKLHRDLPATTLYAYGTSQASATYPGPTLRATRMMTTRIRWENHINDTEHIFTVDRTLPWADPPRGGVPMVVHLHGAETRSDYDGHPNAWFTAAGDVGPNYTTQNYVYPNAQDEAMLWYHDHTVGITRLNTAAGLAGAYFIKSPAEDRLPLPSGYGTFEIPLIIQDKSFWSNGSINFPDIGVIPGIPNWCPDYYGDTILVNGKVWPYMEVYRTKYRFRIVIGSNARFFNFSLSEPGLRFIQIGTDGGFLSQPRSLSSLTMGPGYRADVVIDFSSLPVNTTVFMNNSAPIAFPNGNANIPPDNSPGQRQVMQFRVVARPSGSPAPAFTVPPVLALAERNDSLNTLTALQRNLTMRLQPNPFAFILSDRRFMDPATETPVLGTTEIWTLFNLVGSTHPIHLHLINFRMLDAQPFNQTRFNAGECTFSLPYTNASSCFTGPREPPRDEQVGWKDTIIVYEFKVTRLLTRWQPRNGLPFPFNPTLGPGYVWHCHMLDHEDNDMMRPLLPRFT